MIINNKHVLHIGLLAAMPEELGNILDWIELLKEVDTKSIEPMTGGTDIKGFKREDEINDGGYQEKILKNAPSKNDDLFEVPKVVE